MDVTKMKRVVSAIRRHLDAGEKEDAIALYADAFSVDRAAAEQGVEKLATSEPVAITQSVQLDLDDVGRQIAQVLRTVPGGGMLGGFLKLAGADLTKIARGITIDGGRTGVVTTRASVNIVGGDRAHGPLPTGTDTSPAEAAEPIRSAPKPTEPAKHARRVSVLERQHGRTVERPRGLGPGGVLLVTLAAAAMAAAGVLLLEI